MIDKICKLTIVLISLSLFSGNAFAKVYKCVEQGKVAFSSLPCPESASSSLVKIKNEVPETKRVRGYVSLDGKRMEILDALVLRESRKDDLELHVHLYSFKITDEDLSNIREFKGHALSPRHDQSRNPNSDLWDVTPIVVFQFLLKDPKKPIAMNNIRHWRFVSWMKKVPTTLNNRGNTLVEHVQLIRPTEIEGGSGVQLRTRSGQSFVATKFSWDFDVNAPVIEPVR